MTDHPWPDVSIEQEIIEGAGARLVVGPRVAPDAARIEALAAEHQPSAIMTCWAQVSAQAIRAPRNLKIVARMGVGLDNIDVAAATARGAWVSNVPDYCVEEVSDHAVALLLALARGVASMDREVKAGRWVPGQAQLRRVATLTTAVIGYGRIGAATARKLRAFGCRVLVNSRTLLADPGVGREIAPGVTVADLATIQRSAEVVILHAPLTSETHHLVNDAFIAALEHRPYLINVSRGGLIDNEALVRGLEAGRVAGAGLDVVEGEPNPPTWLTGRADVIATPHMAFSSDASLAEVRERSARDVVRALRGERPLHACNSF